MSPELAEALRREILSALEGGPFVINVARRVRDLAITACGLYVATTSAAKEDLPLEAVLINDEGGAKASRRKDCGSGMPASAAAGACDLDRIERACHEWKAQLGEPWVDDDERIHLNGDTMLALVAIARAAKAVRNARRDGLRGDYDQDVHNDLARALDEAGLTDPAPLPRPCAATTTPPTGPTR